MRVLHVTEALGGGITSALLAMVESTPEIDHHLLASLRSRHDTGADLVDSFASVRVLPRRPAGAVRALRRAVLELDPDVVHAHSSFGGLLVRLSPLNGQPIAYSPHAFGFERRDVPLWQRRLYRIAERVMAVRTDLLLAVSPYEADSARALGYRECRYAPNRAYLDLARPARYGRPLRVAAAGRLDPQKDWRYFAHVKRYAESVLGVEAEWEWLGGGSDDDEATLRAAGVKVSGWIPRAEVLGRLADAQVYLHTASWDAAPITILEAAALGLPMAIRSIPSLDSLRLPGTCADVPELAQRVAALGDAAEWRRAQAASAHVAERHSRVLQGTRLRDAYRMLAASGGARPAGARRPDGVVGTPAGSVRLLRRNAGAVT